MASIVLSRQHSPNLDLLRAVAVLYVFFAHLSAFVFGVRDDRTWHFGQMGVLMFFVHTSLVLMQSLDRSRAAGWSLFQSFYIRRAFRIYPLACFCVLIAYAFSLHPELPGYEWSPRQLLANLLLVQNLTYDDDMVGGLWTLPLEVQMYIALPFCFVAFRSRHIGWLFACWLLAVSLALWQAGFWGRLNVLGYAPCFLAGVIAWKLMGKPHLPAWLWPLGLAALPPIWLIAPRDSHLANRWLFCVALGIAIPLFRDLSVRWITRAAQIIAEYSYGIYLSHMALMMFCFHSPVLAEWARWPLFVVLVAACPVAMSHLIEQPMIRVGKDLSALALSPNRATL